MTPADTVLVIYPDGTASLVGWPAADDARRAVIAAEVGAHPRMRRCGKGILGFSAVEGAIDPQIAIRPDHSPAADPATGDSGRPAAEHSINQFAAVAFAEQGVELEADLRGPVLFARNPSKGSGVKPLTAAQTANLLVVTGARELSEHPQPAVRPPGTAPAAKPVLTSADVR